MRRYAVALLFLVAPVAALEAQTMPVSTFLDKAEALKKKGPMALFSSDIGLLKKEVQNSGKALRAQQVAAQKAGRKPQHCMPEKVSFNSTEILDHFRAIPPAQRNMTVQTAFASLVRKKYPCPA